MPLNRRGGGDVFHIDIMDGHFVSAISFGTGIVRTMGRLTQKPLDVHLMVENPLPFIPELAEEKVKRVSVHYEIPGGPEKALRAIREAGMQAGLVLNPETPNGAAKPYLHGLDRILLMTVCPGRGGQTYLEGSNQKIAGLRSLLDRVGSRAVIQIDGGVPLKTCRKRMRQVRVALWQAVPFLAGPSSPEWLTCGGAVRSDIEENRSSPISDLE